MLCEIYKGNKKAEMYLYVPLNKGLKDVPEVLLQSFGELELVMKLELNISRKLARVIQSKRPIFAKRMIQSGRTTV